MCRENFFSGKDLWTAITSGLNEPLVALLKLRAMARCTRGRLTAGRRQRRRLQPWRGGRAVDRAGLENRKAERSREFESHPLRAFLETLVIGKNSCPA